MALHLSFLGDCQKKIVELQKRVTETGKNVLSRTQRWQRISTVLSTTCDVVLTFSQGTQEEHIQWFIDLLHTRVPELVVQIHKHRTSGQSALYLTACFRDLLMGAEVLGIRKPLAPEHGGGLREFSMEELDLFDGATNETSFLSSGERSYIVYNYLMSLCAREGDAWTDEITFSEGQPLIRALQSVGFIHQIFPVHQVDELKQLKANWGKLTKCPITGRLTRTYPAWRRTLILFFFTGPVVLLSLVAVVLVTFAFVRLQEHADAIAHVDYDSVPLIFLLWYTPKVLLAMVILLMDLGYRRLATWLTDLENHRLDREYHNHLVGKLLLLQFMNSFYSLFYTAFYLQDIEMLQQYDGPDDDFLEMFIQFGYVSMFSCVFPAAGVLALLNNLIEIRGDAFKLTASFQRPFIQSANDIGIWQLAMSFMGYAAVIVNVGLLNVSGAVQDLFPQLDAAQSILLLVVVEHCIFVLYYALAALIPDTPSSVLHQIAKLEHRRREALRVSIHSNIHIYKFIDRLAKV
ncbi:anoctamin-10 [Paragonimus westermani]|uniref:Anoctamin n=1 Tax=Paragonimus westermani TaxID=34504 RepID=A0A5J4NKQ4_9TREM|nr:anoctamin-10 [Paragonimus westermani]